jgi:formate hydrogenlyase subunit 4
MSRPSTHPRLAAFLLLGGFTAWGIAFVVLYAALSFGCAYGWDAMPAGPLSLNRLVLTLVWIASLVAIAAMLAGVVKGAAGPDRISRFLHHAGIALTALALAATAANFFMVTTMSTCL